MERPNPIVKLDESIDLVESGLASRGEVMQALAFKQQLGEIYRAMAFRFEKAAIAWIEANGEIEEGEKRWYVGHATTRKCKDVKATLEALLTETGGDLDALATALSTSCYRPATAMKILGEKGGDYFDVKVEKDLATGKPKKKLKAALADRPLDDDDEQSAGL